MASCGASGPDASLHDLGVTVLWPRDRSLEDAFGARPWRTRESWPPCSGAQRWLEAGKIWYKASDTKDEHVWEMVRRVTRNVAADGSPAEAADVVATVRRRGEEPGVVFIVTYRPPVDAWVVELPAGMVDAGETVRQAAARELQEETGYSVNADDVRVFLGGAAVCYPTPWASTESYLCCEVEVDGDLSVNAQPTPRLEDDEHFAAVLLIPVSKVIQVMEVLVRRHGCLLEPRGVGLAQGLALAGRNG